MELRVLRYFLAVAREQNITAAAAKIHITQPTLSKQLMELEAELGTQLLIRGKRKVTLTEEGEFLRQRAQELVDLADKTTADLQSRDSAISGEIYIGAGETRGMAFVARAMKQMQEHHSLVSFNLYSGDDEIIAERLDRGLLDFGLFVGLTDLSKYDYLRLPMVNRFGLLMRQDDPLSAHQTIEAQLLQELPLICPRQVLQQNDLSWWLGHGLERFKVVATYSLLFNAAILVEEGLGYALCIDGLIENERLCFKPLEQNNTAQLVFAWRRTSMLSQASKCFLEILKPLLKTSSASSVSSAGSSAQP